MSKLHELANIFGFDTANAMAMANMDTCSHPAICTKDGCDYTTELDPDAMDDTCDECGCKSVTSFGVLMGCV